jgi:hypothetical protein
MTEFTIMQLSVCPSGMQYSLQYSLAACNTAWQLGVQFAVQLGRAAVAVDYRVSMQAILRPYAPLSLSMYPFRTLSFPSRQKLVCIPWGNSRETTHQILIKY